MAGSKKTAKTRKTKISDYRQDPRNPNRGTPRGRDLTEESLRRYGAARSIVADNKRVVVAGNGTLEAAIAAGIEKVIEIETDGTELVVVRRTDFDADEEAAQEYAIADNRTSEAGLDWDPNELRNRPRPDGFFSDEEWARLSGKNRDEAPDDFPEYGKDIHVDYQCPKCGHGWSGSPR